MSLRRGSSSILAVLKALQGASLLLSSFFEAAARENGPFSIFIEKEAIEAIGQKTGSRTKKRTAFCVKVFP